jgi:hypothetical protein
MQPTLGIIDILLGLRTISGGFPTRRQTSSIGIILKLLRILLLMLFLTMEHPFSLHSPMLHVLGGVAISATTKGIWLSTMPSIRWTEPEIYLGKV